ncbi:Alpha/Beta hydrolase protein [Entophlyctis helioformis]|nr:Alpha/Beta hydrolase protein [Entophlyctis helioformis]
MQRAVSNSLHLKERDVTVPSTDGVTLKARFFVGDSKRRSTCFVLAHPYGPLGGNYDNNVVEALFANFASMGYSTIRFNFRGVGGSTGRTTFRGIGEIEDVVAVCKYLMSRDIMDKPSRIVLCGYSYGSVAAGAAACDVPEVAAVISISYPAGVLWALTLGNQRKHLDSLQSTPPDVLKLFISGTRDNFTSESSFSQFVATMPEPKAVVVVPDADHFWAGAESTLTGHINQWVAKSLRPHLNEKGSVNSLSIGGSSSRTQRSAGSTSSLPATATVDYSHGFTKTTSPLSETPIAPSADSGSRPLRPGSPTRPLPQPPSISTLASRSVDNLSETRTSPVKGPREMSPARGSLDNLGKT